MALRTSVDVNVNDDLPNGLHLKIDDAIKLLAADTPLIAGRTQTTLSASEGCFANFDRQLSYLHANALGHRPALTCYHVDVIRHSAPPSLLLMGVGRIRPLIGSRTRSIQRHRVSAMPRSTKIPIQGIVKGLKSECRRGCAPPPPT
jgi:hypothetical protein